MTSTRIAVPAAPSRSHLARSSALSFAGSATSALMGLVLIIVIGRTLGDVGAGVVLQVVAAFTIALGVARLGMDSTALWILPRLLEGNTDLVKPTGWFLVGVSGFGGGLGALGLLGVAQVMESAASGTATAAALRSIAIFLPFAAMMLTALAATRAMGRVTAYVLVGSVALPTLRPAVIAMTVAFGGTAVAAGVAWAVPLVPAAAAAIIILAVQMHRLEVGTRPGFMRSTVPPEAARYALPRVISSSLEQLLIWAAVLIVGLIAGSAAAGIYGAATRFVAAGMVVDTALRVVVAPLFSRLLHRQESSELEDLYRTATIWLVLFSAPVYLLLAIFSPVVLSLLGEEFTAGAPVLTVMCLGAILTFLAGNIHSVLLMSGRSGLAAMNKAAAVATNIVLIVVLVPSWGIIGAAVAWVAACALDAALATLEVRIVLRLEVSPMPALRPLLLALGAVAVPALALRLSVGTTWPALITAGLVGCTLLLIISRIDRRRLRLDALSLLRKRSTSTSVNGES